MATSLGRVYLKGCNYELAYDLLSQSTQNNSSSVRFYGILHVTNNYIAWDRGSASVHTSGLQTIGTYYSKGDHTLITRDFTLNHDSNGNYSSYIGASLSTTFVSGDTGGTLTLPKIARHPNITSFTVNKRDETSFTFNFTANTTIDYVWYSTNNGSNWTGYDIADAASGSFTVSGLAANTAYNCKLRVRSKASQLTKDSSTVAQTTYNYPYVTAVGTQNLTIGNSQTLTLYNPLSRNVTVRMYQNAYNGTLLYSASSNKTSVTFTPTASTLYNSIPNTSEGNCVYSVIYGNVVRTTGQYKYSINANNSKPTFEDFQFSTNLRDLTGNNDTVINGKTTTTVTVNRANKAEPKNGASISRYVVQIGNMSPQTMSYSSTTNVSTDVHNCTSTTIKVTAIDSRNLEKSVTKTVTTFRNYFKPAFSDMDAERRDGIEADSFISFKVDFWNSSFGSKQNTIKEIRYRVKESGSSTWTDWTLDKYKIDLTQLTINNNEAILNDYDIYVDGISTDFTVGKSYDIQLKIIDGTDNYAMSEVISGIFRLADGKVAFSIFKDENGEYHIGMNGMPDKNYTLKVHGTVSNS